VGGRSRASRSKEKIEEGISLQRTSPSEPKKSGKASHGGKAAQVAPPARRRKGGKTYLCAKFGQKGQAGARQASQHGCEGKRSRSPDKRRNGMCLRFKNRDWKERKQEGCNLVKGRLEEEKSHGIGEGL